jgi:chromosome segregation ATPase
MATTTMEQLNTEVRILASEVEGEKAVTRYSLEQVRMNTHELTAFRAEARMRLDNILSDIPLIKAAQVAQGGTLNILVQDVRALRLDTTALRRDMEQVNFRLDKVEARLDKVEARLDKIETRLDNVETKLDRLENLFQEGIAAILAAVSPRNPA